MAGCRSFRISRGVKQGSVLSPELFLLVMNPLLRDLEASGVGLSLNGYYAGGFLHADHDTRTLATSEESLMKLFELVKQFAERNLPKLSVNKC